MQSVPSQSIHDNSLSSLFCLLVALVLDCAGSEDTCSTPETTPGGGEMTYFLFSVDICAEKSMRLTLK